MNLYGELKKLCSVSGISGRERGICEYIRSEIEGLADSVSVDALGNLIALKKGSVGEKKIMLCAHLDEIGFLVNFIDEKGFVRVAPIGGINFLSAAFSSVVSDRGVHGVLVPEADAKPEELCTDKVYIDIGAQSRAAAERRVSVGDFFVCEPTLKRLSGSRVCGRPIDDRVGCLVLIELLRSLSGTKLKNDIYFVFSTQEEVGCRGSQGASFNICPDEAICVDVTATGDTLGAKPMDCAIGKGVAIKIKDSSVICHERLVTDLRALAEENKIAVQNEVLLFGGTDTSSMQLSGVGCTAGALSIPTRYIHSSAEMCDMSDVEGCISLLRAYIFSRG